MSDLASMFKVSIPAVVVAAAISAFGSYVSRPPPAPPQDAVIQQLTAMRQEMQSAQVAQKLEHLESEVQEIKTTVQILQSRDSGAPPHGR